MSVLLTVFAACNKEGSSQLVVRMIDSPGDFEEVNIDIREVTVNVNDEWISLETEAGIYDLLELTGGAEAVLADADIPSGKISQLRLVLGPENSLLIDGTDYPLTTPSSQQSGLKINIDQNLDEGITYSILLDFDAARSIVSTGSGKYILKPVIRAIAEARTGIISGTVLPAEENVAVYAKFDGNALGTTYAAENNAQWVLTGLEPGTYSIEFDPGENSTYAGAIIEGVEVEVGKTTDIGETVLELK